MKYRRRSGKSNGEGRVRRATKSAVTVIRSPPEGTAYIQPALIEAQCEYHKRLSAQTDDR
jgi:hypothetical protein